MTDMQLYLINISKKIVTVGGVLTIFTAVIKKKKKN